MLQRINLYAEGHLALMASKSTFNSIYCVQKVSFSPPFRSSDFGCGQDPACSLLACSLIEVKSPNNDARLRLFVSSILFTTSRNIHALPMSAANLS